MTLTTPIELVIFDCDGVLVDSEVLSASVLTQLLAEVGFNISPDMFRSDFLGRSFAAAAAKTEARFGRALPRDIQLQYRARLLAAMRGQLKPMPGVAVVLQNMRVPFCLATGSSPERLAMSLSETGLAGYFVDRCFTASRVTHGKPAPDLFHLAAREMKASPARAVIIEDSESGLRAGLAAGAEVWHFTGGSHMREALPLPSDVVPHKTITSMALLQEAFRARGICG
jgi:HAD superfamily hydrolase (TIGR01509 family)